MSKWIAFNDPYFTDEPPYCNTIRCMTEEDAIQFFRRTHPNYPGTDQEILTDFMVVNWAWHVQPPQKSEAEL